MSGPSAVCGSNIPFSLSNVPAGSTVTWNRSGNLAYVSGQGTPTYTVSKTSNGSGFVTAVVNSSTCGSTNPVQKNIQVGPTTANFSITAYPDCGSPYDVITFVADINNVNYSWTVNGGTLLGGQGTQSIYAQVTSPSMAVHCYVTGTSSANCFSPSGISSKYIYECYEFSSLSVSPNPATNSLTLELDQPGQHKSVAVELRNSFGNSVRKIVAHSNKIEIDIEDLPKGLYVVKVTSNGQVFNRRILIEK